MSSGGVYPAVSSATSSATVLVVDDDPDHRDLLVELLNRAGCDALGTDALQAMEMIEVREPFMVVLDLLMPGLNGWHLADSIRRERPDCVITISSVLDTAQYPAADDVLPKPFHGSQVTELVRRHLTR